MDQDTRAKFLSELDKQFEVQLGNSLSRGINVHTKPVYAYDGTVIPDAKEIFSVLALDTDVSKEAVARLILTPDGRVVVTRNTTDAAKKFIVDYNGANNLDIPADAFAQTIILINKDHSVSFRPIIGVKSMSAGQVVEYRELIRKILPKLGISEKQMLMGKIKGDPLPKDSKLIGVSPDKILDIKTLQDDGEFRIFTLKDVHGGISSFADDMESMYGTIDKETFFARPISMLSKEERKLRDELQLRLRSDKELRRLPELTKKIVLSDNSEAIVSYSSEDVVRGIEGMNKLLHARSYVTQYAINNLETVGNNNDLQSIISSILGQLPPSDYTFVHPTFGSITSRELRFILNNINTKKEIFSQLQMIKSLIANKRKIIDSLSTDIR